MSALKYVFVFIAVGLVIAFAFGAVSNYVVASKIGVIEFYDFPVAKYTGKNILRYFTSAANFLSKFSHNTFVKFNPRLSPYYELLEDYKANIFSFIWFSKYMAVDSIKSDVAQYNFISCDTLSEMRSGFKQSDMDKFASVFDKCYISHPHYYSSTLTATFSDTKYFQQLTKNTAGYIYYRETYDGAYNYIPRALCFAFTDSNIASSTKWQYVYVPISSYMIVECSLYSEEGLLDIDAIYEYAKKKKNDDSPMGSLYGFLTLAFNNNYDFDYTFFIPDDYTSIPWTNGMFHYSGVDKTVTASNTVNFDFGNVGDTQ